MPRAAPARNLPSGVSVGGRPDDQDRMTTLEQDSAYARPAHSFDLVDPPRLPAVPEWFY